MGVIAIGAAIVVVERLLDLILGHRDVGLADVVIGTIDYAGGDQALLGEDPEAGIDNEERRLVSRRPGQPLPSYGAIVTNEIATPTSTHNTGRSPRLVRRECATRKRFMTC
jgi:hypothetical protein